jgi:hypothetical protein
MPTSIPQLAVAEKTTDQLKDRLAQLKPPDVLLKVLDATTAGNYACQLLRLAPKVPAGYQTDGGWQLSGAPEGMTDGVIVAAQAAGKVGQFAEIFGRLAPPLSRPPASRPPHKRR